MRFLFLLFILSSSIKVMSQDTSFVKIYYAGSYAQVPEGKMWQFEKVFISNGDGYNIKISNQVFEGEFVGGAKIQIPYYIAEMELLSSGSMMSYTVNINQKNVKE
jgi:hypothetical protein